MRRSGWHPPGGSLRASAFGTFTAALVAVTAAGWAGRALLPLSARFPLTGAAIVAAVMLLAIGFLADRHPFERMGSANQVTTARAGIVALIGALTLELPLSTLAGWGVAAGCLAAVLDGVDGRLARRSRMSSEFGARFDLEIDALLIMVLATLVWQHGKAGPWVLLSGLMRYGFVAGGGLWPPLASPLPPSIRRQAICVVQIAGLLIALTPIVPFPASAWAAALSLAALVWSFAVDVAWLTRHRLPAGNHPARSGSE